MILLRVLDAKVNVEKIQSVEPAGASRSTAGQLADKTEGDVRVAANPAPAVAGSNAPTTSTEGSPTASKTASKSVRRREPTETPPLAMERKESASPEPIRITNKVHFLGVTNTREWDRIIAGMNLAITTLNQANPVHAEELEPLRQMVLRAAFGDDDYEFYVSRSKNTDQVMIGEEKARWFILDLRAKKLPATAGNTR
jgi:hypothetical protein